MDLLDLLRNLKMSLLDFNIATIYIIHKITWIILKIVFSNAFLKSGVFLKHVVMKSLNLEEEKIIKNIRNIFR